MLLAKLKFRLLTSVLVLLWCGNFIALKVCLRFLSPFGVTTFRVVVAAIVLLVIYGFWGGRQSPRKLCRQDALDFLKLAFVGLFLNQTLFILGLSQTNVAHSALMVTFGPVFTLLFAWMRGQERLRRMALLGMLVSVAGIALMNLEKDFTFQTRYLVGDLLTLSGSIAFAYYTVISKNAVDRYGALDSTAFTYFAGALLFLPWGLPLMARLDWLHLPWSGVASFFYVAFLSSVLAQLIFYYALRRMSASSLASLQYLQPVITTIFSVLLLSEHLSLNFVVGGCIIIGGIILTHSNVRRT